MTFDFCDALDKETDPDIQCQECLFAQMFACHFILIKATCKKCIEKYLPQFTCHL